MSVFVPNELTYMEHIVLGLMFLFIVWVVIIMGIRAEQNELKRSDD